MTLWLGMTFNDLLVSGQLGWGPLTSYVRALCAAPTAHMSAHETFHHAVAWDGWMAGWLNGKTAEALGGQSMSITHSARSGELIRRAILDWG